MQELSRYERDRLRYLEYYEGYLEKKGGLTDAEHVELLNLRKRAEVKGVNQ